MNLPMLIHYKEKEGGSYYSMSLIKDLALEGRKILLFTGFPAAKDQFFRETKPIEKNIAVVNTVEDIKKNNNKHVIIIHDADENLCLEAIKILDDINDRVIFIKNIDIVHQKLLHECLKHENIILSGNLDLCSAKETIVKKNYTSVLLFSQPKTILPFTKGIITMNYKETTINSYNQHAQEFSDKFKRGMNLDRREEFQKFLNLLTGKKILDLGCRSGAHALYFKEKGLEVTCIDLSEEMIKLCKEKGLDAYVMDIEHLPFNNNSFDGIRAATSLLHIPKLKLPNVILTLHTILKKNGILHISLKEGDGEHFVEDTLGTTQRFFAFWQEEELKKVFAPYFTFLESQIITEGKNIFLKVFFRKR